MAVNNDLVMRENGTWMDQVAINFTDMILEANQETFFFSRQEGGGSVMTKGSF